MIKSISIAGIVATGLFVGGTPALADCHDAKVEGTVGGAIVGGVIGSQFGRGGGRTAATVGGVLLGGLAGNAIARDSCRDERADEYYYDNTYYDAFDSRDNDRQYEWHNPYNNHRGYVRPTAYYDDGYRGHSGPCREFEQHIWVDGREETDTGIACRERDGSWRVEND